MLIDTHVHTAPVSLCGRTEHRELIDLYIQAGYGAFVLTNHYSRVFMEQNGVSFTEWLDVYIGEFDQAAAYGRERGFTVLFGAEVTLYKPYADYLLFGADHNFFYRNARLFDLSQSELFGLCRENGVLLIQAHPFRREHGHSLQNVKYLDGLEINCHGQFDPLCARVIETARQNGLIVTVGGDVHCAGDAARCAIQVPDSIKTAGELAAYFTSGAPLYYRISAEAPLSKLQTGKRK